MVTSQVSTRSLSEAIGGCLLVEKRVSISLPNEILRIRYIHASGSTLNVVPRIEH